GADGGNVQIGPKGAGSRGHRFGGRWGNVAHLPDAGSLAVLRAHGGRSEAVLDGIQLHGGGSDEHTAPQAGGEAIAEQVHARVVSRPGIYPGGGQETIVYLYQVAGPRA